MDSVQISVSRCVYYLSLQFPQNGLWLDAQHGAISLAKKSFDPHSLYPFIHFFGKYFLKFLSRSNLKSVPILDTLVSMMSLETLLLTELSLSSLTQFILQQSASCKWLHLWSRLSTLKQSGRLLSKLHCLHLDQSTTLLLVSWLDLTQSLKISSILIFDHNSSLFKSQHRMVLFIFSKKWFNQSLLKTKIRSTMKTSIMSNHKIHPFSMRSILVTHALSNSEPL